MVGMCESGYHFFMKMSEGNAVKWVECAKAQGFNVRIGESIEAHFDGYSEDDTVAYLRYCVSIYLACKHYAISDLSNVWSAYEEAKEKHD